MDGVNEVVTEDVLLSPRATLKAIQEQIEHALGQRLARRFSTRESLKQLERRAESLAKQEDGRGWDEEFGKLVKTADAVFGQLINEVEAGHA